MCFTAAKRKNEKLFLAGKNAINPRYRGKKTEKKYVGYFRFLFEQTIHQKSTKSTT